MSGARADDAGDEAEVGRESVVESVDDVAQKAARSGAMPRLAGLSRYLIERRRVLGRLARERQRLVRARRAARRAPMHVEIAFDLATLFGEQHRQQEFRAEHLAEAREEPRARARDESVPGSRPCVAQQAGPHLDVPVFDLGEPPVQILLLRVRLGVGQEPVQIRRVGFVLPMMGEGVEIGRRRRGGGHG